MNDRRVLNRFLAALLTGLAGVVGTLVLLTAGASASPLRDDAGLSISKSQNTARVQPGDHVVYTLTYQNASTDTLTGVVVSDLLDANVSYLAASRSPAGGLPDAPFWSIGSLSPSMSGAVVLTVVVASPLPDRTILTNTAAVESSEAGPLWTQVTATVEAPDLALVKRADPDPVPSGAPLTYTLAYSNAGHADATGVVISDALDSRLTYVSASPAPADPTAPVLRWDLDTLPPSAADQIVIQVDVPAGLGEDTALTNTAVLESQQTAPLTVELATDVLAHGDPISVSLTPTATTVAAGQPVAYTLVATDTSGNDWIAGPSATYTITPGAGGIWAAHVYTAEKDGAWTVTAAYEGLTDTAILTVTNVPPTAVIGGPGGGDEGQTLTFDAGQSYDPGNDIVAYEWDWEYIFPFSPDAAGVSLPHTYADDGLYTLALRVTDDNGATDVATATIAVANVSPVVDAGPDQTVSEDEAAYFSGGFTDPGADSHTIHWEFGDGASQTGLLTPSHVYTEPGDFVVTLTVTDDDGGVGQDTLAVTVVNEGPTVDAGGPYAGTAGSPVTLSASGSDPGGGPITFEWDLDGDDQFDDATGATVTYTWFEAGTHTVRVRATDSEQATATDFAPVTISPADLSYVVLSPQSASVPAGQALAYTVEAFDAHGNSLGDVTAEATFRIVEPGHGGSWSANVYTSANYGDWTVEATYVGVITVQDSTFLTVLLPELHLAKTADRVTVEAGDLLTYTITYSNTGNQTAAGLVITDTLDPDVTYVSASPIPTRGLPDTPVWAIGDFAAEGFGQVELTVAANVPLPDGAWLTNMAWIDSYQTAPLSDTVNTAVTSHPVLILDKTDYPDPVDAGGTLRYTLIVSNTGTENASGVTIVEDYDPNVSFFYANPRPDHGTGNRVWTLPTVAVGQPETIDVIVTVASPLPVGTVLTGRSVMYGDDTEPMTVTEITSVTSASELTLSQVDLSDPVEPGETLVYFITYQNFGTAPATDVVITDTYDARVTFVSATPLPDAGTDNVWHLGDVPVNEGGTIIVRVRVDTPLPNGTLLTNRVTIDSAHTSPQDYVETTQVASAPDLTFTVTDEPDPVEAGESLTYTLHYTNAGTADATWAVVTATLDSNVSFSSATPPPDGGGGQVWHWNAGTIAGEGGCGEIVIHTNVTVPLANGTTLNFAAQVADVEGDRLETTAETTVTSTPVLTLEKDDGVYTVYAGELLTYTLTFDNSGNANETNITITDTLPGTVTYLGCHIDTGSCELATADQVILQIPYLDAGTAGQAQIFVRVDDPLPAGTLSLVNMARMTAPSLAAPVDVQDVDPVGTKPDLRVAVRHEPSLFSPGELMTYTLTYGNAGQHMHTEGVIITTELPTDTVYIGYGWYSADGHTYTYPVGDLPAGSVGHTAEFVVRHPDEPEISAPEFRTPFAIAESGGGGGDENPADNSITVVIGVPDLVVAQWEMRPDVSALQPNQPVTFTIVVENQGTGVAWNPDNHASFYLDVFIAPVPSYPWERYTEKDIFAKVPPLAPGAKQTVVITRTGTYGLPIRFSQAEIMSLIEQFYLKVDNFAQPIYDGDRVIGWTRLYGIVPEWDEMNNLGQPIDLGLQRLYLPFVVR